MISGSREIQKRMKAQVPKTDELMKVWIQRAAKFYNLTYIQAENIYYRKGYDVPNTMYVKLTKGDRGLSTASKMKRLEQSEIRDAHLNEIIGDKLETIIHTALADYLASHNRAMPRTTR